MDDVRIINNPQEVKTRSLTVESEKKGNFLVIALTVVITLLVAVIAFLLYRTGQGSNGAQTQLPTTTISGQVEFTSLKPDPGDAGNVKLFYRKSGTTDQYLDSGLNIALTNNQTWSWDQAVVGETYDLKVALVIFGEEIKNSTTKTVSAPARNIKFDLAIKWSDLPPTVVASSDIPISGKIKINGLIPENAVVKVYQNAPNSQDLGSEVFSINTPTSTTDWSWQDAIPLTKYSLTAVLLNSSSVEVGRSSQLIIAESADSSVNMTINSQATPPSPAKVTVSGTTNINGPIQPNSTLLITAKRSTDPAFVIVAEFKNITSDSQEWSWTEADSGQGYELAAGLQVNGSYTAITPAKFITAPATSLAFTINSNFKLPKPTGVAKVQSCVDSKTIGFSEMTVLLPKITGAGKYWLQIGTTSGDSNTYDNKITSNGTDDLTVVVYKIKNNTTYYGKYTYTQSANSDDDSNFAEFSEVAELSCSKIEPR